MNSGFTIEYKIHLKKGERGRTRILNGEDTTKPSEPGRIPRISRLMALAIRFENLIQRGEVRDLAELARRGHVSRARITQIMNLLHLAPEIQEDILFLPRIMKGSDRITERQMRNVTEITDWGIQREMWRELGNEG